MSQYPAPDGGWDAREPKTEPSDDVPIKSEDDGLKEEPIPGCEGAQAPPNATQHEWYSQGPLPSQLLESYRPPSELFTETMPVADPAFWSSGSFGSASPPATAPPTRDPNFAVRANDLINEMLGRQPGGTSVVEPESVLGDSGRLYHGYKDGKYFLPNDAAEQDRLDMQHHLWYLMLDGWLALAPLKETPKYVLDVGTGTGLWATDFATQNPSSFVIGTDLSAIQPPPRVPNVLFTKDDAEDEWIFPCPLPEEEDPSSQGKWVKFDYVHLRLMFSCFNNPHLVLKHAYDNMNPGGWIEFQETALDLYQDNPDFHGDAMERWARSCKRGAASMGRDIDVAKKYRPWLEAAGFVDVTEKRYFIPMSPWAKDPKFKEIGKFQMQNLLEGVRGIGWKMLSAAGMTPEEIEALVSEVHAEVRTRNNHSYGYVYVIYGRKPLPGEVEAKAASPSV